MGSLGTDLPPEFDLLSYRPQPWSPQDCIAIGKVFTEALSSNWMSDLMRASFADLSAADRADLLVESSPLDLLVLGDDNVLRPFAETARLVARPEAFVRLDQPSNDRLVKMVQDRARRLKRVGLRPASLRAASNNWVISGAHTASGLPLLANDPHLDSSAPCIWYLAHLTAPNLRVAGVTIPGLPNILIGHNDYCAWGFTNLGGDEQDLYKETFSPSDAVLYLTPGGWQRANLREEQVLAKEQSGQTTVHQLTVVTTNNGPIVFDDGHYKYALRWTAFDTDAAELVAMYRLNRASELDQLRAALAAYKGPSMNCVWATHAGDIGYQVVGKIPQRQDDDGTLPYDGATEQGAWIGYIPFEKLPSVINPDSGVVVTANNRVVGRSYPFFITYGWAEPYRARRIWNLIKEGKPIDGEYMARIQLDTYAYGEAIFAGEVVKAASSHPDNDQWQEILSLLGEWDGRVTRQSRQMPIALGMREAFARTILENKLGPDRTNGYWWWPNRECFIDHVLATRPRHWLPPAFASWEDLFLASYQAAITNLEQNNGPDRNQWTWDRTSTPLNFPHPLAQPGNVFYIDPLGRHTGDDDSATVNRGELVSMRLVASLDNWDVTRQGLTLGQSGNPKSPHWKDQLNNWAQGATEIFPFTHQAVAKSTNIDQILVAKDFSKGNTRRQHMGVGAAFGKVLSSVQSSGDASSAQGASDFLELTLKDLKLSQIQQIANRVGAGGALNLLSGLDPNMSLGDIRVKDIAGMLGSGAAPGVPSIVVTAKEAPGVLAALMGERWFQLDPC
jgi:penicillin amidase